MSEQNEEQSQYSEIETEFRDRIIRRLNAAGFKKEDIEGKPTEYLKAAEDFLDKQKNNAQEVPKFTKFTLNENEIKKMNKMEKKKNKATSKLSASTLILFGNQYKTNSCVNALPGAEILRMYEHPKDKHGRLL